MTELSAIERRLQRLEAVEAIRDLASRYCWGADHRDLAVWESVWAPGATWRVAPERAFVGLDEIRAAVQVQWATFPRMLHATTNHRVRLVDEHRATGVADVVVMTQLGTARGPGAAPGSWVTGGGTYRDEYLRIGDDWFLLAREASDTFLHGPAHAVDLTTPVDD